jgi:hypothetical protein
MSTEPKQTGDTDLETLSKRGKAPKSRLSSPKSAYNILKRLIDRDQTRSEKRAIIQGQIDGNSPYDNSELVRLGQAHRSNVNFREAEAARDARKTSYYELLMEVETLVDVKLKPKVRNDENPVDIGEIIAEEFTNMLTEWPGFWYNMLLHQQQLITWGVGNCYWENEIDWRFKAARAGSFLVPDETLSTMDDLDLIAIRHNYKVHELFKYVEDKETEKKSKAAGWDTKQIKELIIEAVNKGSNTDKWSLGTWESHQQMMKDNDLEYTYSVSQRIPIANILVKEFDGKISHFIISEDKEQTNEKDGESAKFLFKKVKRYESWHQAVCLFFADIGDGTYHSIRGLGAKIFAHCVLSDRLMNTTVDGALTSATILVEPSNEAQKEKVRMVRVGPISVMPSGYNVIPHTSFQPNLQGLIGVKGLLDANLNRNVGLQRPGVTETEKTPTEKTVAELRMKATNEAKLEKSDINMYYIQWDLLYQEVMRRALNPSLTSVDDCYKSAKAFIDACIERGVPKELLKAELLKVTARRAIGFGSPVMKSLITADILSVSPYFDERGKDNAIRDYVAARAGTTGVNRYKPPRNRNQIPSSEHSHISLENNDLREGTDVVVGTDQPHVIHLMLHMRDLIQMADAYVNGQIQDVERAFAYFDVGLRHCAQHLDYLVDDPARQNEYRALRNQFSELVRIHTTMQAQVNKLSKDREQAAAEQAELMRRAQESVEDKELQIELAKIQSDLRLKVLKEQNNNAVRVAKAQHGMQIKEALAAQELRIKELQAVGTE